MNERRVSEKHKSTVLCDILSLSLCQSLSVCLSLCLTLYLSVSLLMLHVCVSTLCCRFVQQRFLCSLWDRPERPALSRSLSAI